MRRSKMAPLLKRAMKLALKQQKAWLAVAAGTTPGKKSAKPRKAASSSSNAARPRPRTALTPRGPLGTARLGPGRWEASHWREAGRRLDAFRYVPADLVSVVGAPVVVMLHGCRQTATDFALGTRMNALADAQGFVVLYPQQAVSRQANRCWRWFEPDTGRGLAEADLIAGFVRREVERLALDPTRVYVAGLSAGAGMAALLAVRHPDLVSAVAMHSGAILGDAHSALAGLRTMRHGGGASLPLLDAALAAPRTLRDGMPALVIHGLNDRAVDVKNAAGLARQFALLNGLGATPADTRILGAGTRREYQRSDYRIGARVRVRVCVVPQLDHAWSGGDPEIAFHAAHGPDASRLVWQFFRAHSGTSVPAGTP